MPLIGQSIPRCDAEGKVTGDTKFGGDFYEPGMLFARMLRSEHASADILGIDTAEAESQEGVVGVYTARDMEGTNRHGLIIRDQTVLAETRVRYMGDAVAIVLAENEHIAEEALKLIRVNYRPHKPITTIDEALADGARHIHPKGNVMVEKRIRKGDAKGALRNECDVVVQETFNTQTVDHAFLDLEAGCAEYDGKLLTIRASGQWVHEERRLIALALGVPVERVRIIQPATGGAFGGREDISIQICLGMCALKNPGRGIYMHYSRAESMSARHKRHAIRCRYTLGAKSSHATGPYRVPNVEVDVYGVHTNNNPTGAMRGFGAAQMAIAYEGIIDQLAGKLGMDRVELRLKNLIRSGECVTTRQVIPNATPIDCLHAALARFARIDHSVLNPESGIRESLSAWRLRNYETQAAHLRRGYGVSAICFGLGYGDNFPDTSRARVCFNSQAGLEVYSGAVECGQGVINIIAQIAAEEMGMPIGCVRVTVADTLLTPESGSSSATRQTYFTGTAVKMACAELREQLFDIAGAYFGVHPFEVVIEDGILYNKNDRSQKMSVGEVFALGLRRGHKLEATGIFKPPTQPENHETGLSQLAFITYLFGAHIAQVLVDTETGEVSVERYIACHDVGKAINPQQIEGQIQGGVAQGIGMAVMEEVIFSDHGKLLNTGFTDYIIPTIRDLPQIEVVIYEGNDASGPYGAHGVGEPPLIGTTPAMVGAISDALGIPITRTPATPERIWRVIQQAGTLRQRP
ncbi:MAG: xanthine dehydrogenase family protein molybdopterin-binding subunit [Candidatus Sumerlaeota bacterium]|nr:xanthine dehydrogenase family protein molybdopterin-binding subunit [Candidatus Sumerlaeota bacterium]